MNAGVEGKVTLCIVPLPQQTLALRRLQDWQFSNGSIETVDNAFQQCQIMICHAPDSSGIEQIDVVAQAAVNILSVFFEIESEVKRRRSDVKSERTNLDAGQLEYRVG